MTILTAACIQLNARPDVPETLAQLTGLIREAAGAGARLVATPENSGFLAFGRKALMQLAQPEEAHDALAALKALAGELGIWLLVGSLAVKLEDKLANRSYLIDPEGGVVAHYDKIHLFDVDLGNGEAYRESAAYQAGARAVLGETGFARIGMTVCYDLRFPQLYRRLAQAGAAILTVPSAFTVPTGEAHWHVLLRARAIETGCFVLAPAQTGTHDRGRQTFGHSLIIDPWGEVLADGGTAPGVIRADLDLTRVEAARKRMPSLDHDRPFTLD